MIDSTKLVAYFVARKEITFSREVIPNDVDPFDDGIGEEYDIEITEDTIIEE